MNKKLIFVVVVSILFLAGCSSPDQTAVDYYSTGPTTVPPTSRPTATPNPNMSKNNAYSTAPAVLPAAQLANKKAEIVTAKGKIVIDLFGDEAPIAVSNFIFLTEKGYFNSLVFHRREEGFVIQGGDPLGNGTGGPGYTFEDEPVMRPYKRGVVAMANRGPDTNGSQFFIMLADNNTLPPSYTIFGQVTSGLDVVDNIKIGDVMQTVTIK